METPVVRSAFQRVLEILEPETRQGIVDLIGEDVQLGASCEYTYHYHLGIPFKTAIEFYLGEEDNVNVKPVIVDETPKIMIQYKNNEGKPVLAFFNCSKETVENVTTIIMTMIEERDQQ